MLLALADSSAMLSILAFLPFLDDAVISLALACSQSRSQREAASTPGPRFHFHSFHVIPVRRVYTMLHPALLPTVLSSTQSVSSVFSLDWLAHRS
jgi:hypothetical protein